MPNFDFSKSIDLKKWAKLNINSEKVVEVASNEPSYPLSEANVPVIKNEKETHLSDNKTTRVKDKNYVLHSSSSFSEATTRPSNQVIEASEPDAKIVKDNSTNSLSSPLDLLLPTKLSNRSVKQLSNYDRSCDSMSHSDWSIDFMTGSKISSGSRTVNEILKFENIQHKLENDIANSKYHCNIPKIPSDETLDMNVANSNETESNPLSKHHLALGPETTPNSIDLTPTLHKGHSSPNVIKVTEPILNINLMKNEVNIVPKLTQHRKNSTPKKKISRNTPISNKKISKEKKKIKSNSIRKLKVDKIAFKESELGQMFSKMKEKKIQKIKIVPIRKLLRKFMMTGLRSLIRRKLI